MRIFITGAEGQLGTELVELCRRKEEERRRDPIVLAACARARCDVTRRDSVMATICDFEPDVVFHTAAWTAVDACEADPDRAHGVNALGTRNVAEACRSVGAHLVYVSTDYVFDGTATRPYSEWDAPAPLSVYGKSKLAGEHEVPDGSTVVRTAWLVGRFGSNIVLTVLRLAREGAFPLRFVDDQRGSPTVASDLAAKVLELGIARRDGLFHVTNRGDATWFSFVSEVIASAGIDRGVVEPIATSALDPPRPAPRPAYSVLDNAALRLGREELLPPWEESVGRLVREIVGTGG